MKKVHNIKGKIKLLHIAQSAGYGVSIYVESLIRNIDNDCFQQVLLGSDYYNKEPFVGIADRL